MSEQAPQPDYNFGAGAEPQPPQMSPEAQEAIRQAQNEASHPDWQSMRDPNLVQPPEDLDAA